MRELTVIRRVDMLGRVVLPIEMRRATDIINSELVAIAYDSNIESFVVTPAGNYTDGYVRTNDSLGRVVLPKEIRDVLNIVKGTPMRITYDGVNIRITKEGINCIMCGRDLNYKDVELKLLGNDICKKCLIKVADAIQMPKMQKVVNSLKSI